MPETWFSRAIARFGRDTMSAFLACAQHRLMCCAGITGREATNRRVLANPDFQRTQSLREKGLHP